MPELPLVTERVETARRPPRWLSRSGWLRPRRVLLLAALLGAGGIYLVYRYRRANAPFEWSGTVEARTISIGSRVGGRVQLVLAKEGDRVDTGQPLLLLEGADLPAQRLAAEGELEQA